MNELTSSALFTFQYRVRIVVLAALFFALGYANPTRPCSPPQPGIYNVFPESGSTLPSNASVVFWMVGVMPEELSATIDGATAQVEVVTEFSYSPSITWYQTLAVRLDPVPTPGSQNRILQDFRGKLRRCGRVCLYGCGSR
jgi:hypothetical protein